MLTIAKTLDQHGKALEVLLKQPTAPAVTPGIESTIEHNSAAGLIRMDVQFSDAMAMSYDERMKKSEDFLADLEEMFRDYKVSALRGSYGTIRPI